MIFAEKWAGFAGVFGGRVVAELVAAVKTAPDAERLAGLEPVALFAEFSAAVDLGAAEVTADVLHAGRRTALVATGVSQPGSAEASAVRRRASAQVKLVRTEGQAGLPRREIAGPPRRTMADLPAVESLPQFETPYPPMPYSELTDVRLIDHRTEHGMPRTRAWVRLDDSADAVAELTPAGHAAVLLDVVPPGPFFGDPEVAFVPTVDFAMHRAPGTRAGGWHLAEGATEWSAGGFCAESTVLWTADGRFVARGTQTRRVLRHAG